MPVTQQPAVPRGANAAGWLTGGHWVTIQAWSANLTVQALLGPEGARPTAGGVEWEVIARPHEVGITERKGRHNYGMTLDILIEGWVTRGGGGLHVEGHIDTLREMADAPHTVRVIGAIPLWGRQWVITGIDYGDCIRDVVTGKRMRQQLTLTLLEYVQIDDFKLLPRADAKPTGTRNYTIKRGDDLQKIAQKQLGKQSRWKEIEALNAGMRGWKLDSRLYRVGSVIRIPGK